MFPHITNIFKEAWNQLYWKKPPGTDEFNEMSYVQLIIFSMASTEHFQIGSTNYRINTSTSNKI